jgi:hypothetical protein
MTTAKLGLLLVCLMSVTFRGNGLPRAEEPKEAKVTPLFSKDLPDFPGKEGVMITVEYPPGSSDPSIATTQMRLFMSWRARS